VAGELTEAMRAEVEDLARRFGEPVRVDAKIHDGFFDPIKRPDRVGEVCMVIRRPSGRILLSTKTFYPKGAYRLPTGGIDIGESIEAALTREAHEETGLTVAVRRFLAAISYRPQGGGSHLFHTFAFLLDELGGTLGSLDPHERILDYREAAPTELPKVADRLGSLASARSDDIVGDWAEWGRFRAVVHRAVCDLLNTV
jgi:8-oxo-dGTP pyrophosphatase MutT (NUDIX family)